METRTFTATITMPSRDSARSFASLWAQKSMMGYDLSATHLDGTATLKLYNVTPELKDWIEETVSRFGEWRVKS